MKRTLAAAAAAVLLVACKGIIDPLCGCSMPAPEAVIAGTVSNPSGAPVPGALVRVQPMANGSCVEYDTTVLRTATAGPGGRYRYVESWSGSENKCFHVWAQPPAGSVLAASELRQVRIDFSGGRPEPDSVVLDLRLR